ncbi:MAG: sel1 repeat family protein [Acidobacteriaceae bacterium]|nr:sel1 repeat family protein [Acidobacteriaceae bacterium]
MLLGFLLLFVLAAMVGVYVQGHATRTPGGPALASKHPRVADQVGLIEYSKGFELANQQPPNYEDAEKHLRVAIEHGMSSAQTELGWLYFRKALKTEGFERIRLYKAASELGNVMAAFNLGEMYFHGKGIWKDYHEAFKWLSLAAEQGDFNAQMYLGTMYGRGDLGLPRDDVQAYMWFNLAAAQDGHATELAAQRREAVARGMSLTEIAEAQQLAREWKPKPARQVESVQPN